MLDIVLILVLILILILVLMVVLDIIFGMDIDVMTRLVLKIPRQTFNLLNLLKSHLIFIHQPTIKVFSLQ